MRTPWILLAAAALAGCSLPPPSAFVAGGGLSGRRSGLQLGTNAAGEACTQQETSDGSADVYCGTWQQPSARVRAAGPATSEQLAGLATASPWRSALDGQFICAAPQSTAILGDVPAELMQCTQRIGGWPHVALVASVAGRGWYADGVLPALPAMERSLGVMSDRLPPGAARAQPSSAADALLADRLAAHAFSSGDVGDYDRLIKAGDRANQDEDFAAAETAFRAALAVQQKALGHDAPATATPLMLLALQVSDLRRFDEAAGLLARAQRLSDKAGDPAIAAQLLDVRALDQQNQGHHAAALDLLRQAEAAYAAQLPPEILHARPRPTRALILATQARASAAGLGELLPDRDLLTDVRTRAALLGVIEARRYQAIVLRDLGRQAEADAALQSAAALMQANGLRVPELTARLVRTQAQDAASRGQPLAASDDFAQASAAFATALPQSRPLAETVLLRAGQLVRLHRDRAALAACDQGAALLRSLKFGTRADLLQPCLDTMGQAAQSAPPDERQALLARMFELAQLAQGSITTQEIAQATVRLSEGARDPRVGEAIRRKQQADAALGALYAQRDAAAQARQAGETAAAAPADLDRQITEAQAQQAQADAALQAASPNYGQLVQQVAPAADVLRALRPGEAFAAIDLGPDAGWIFLLRDGRIDAARIAQGEATIAALVAKVRASIEGESDTPPPFDAADAQRLYADAFGGVAGRMAGIKALVVAPTGPLLSLPFGLLLTGPADPQALQQAPWLLRQASIAHVPAAANFVSLRRIAGGSRAAQPWFGFGDFRPVTLAQARRSFPGATCADSAQLFAGLPPLPFAQKELAAARALLGASPSDELLGAAFTAPAVLRANLRDFRVLHFATHALLPTDLHCEDEPAIVTSAPAGAVDASGALLTAGDVQNMDLDADAVILSACNTGGPAGGAAGQSLSGLARAFFYAGARGLVITHWSVNDQTAAYLVADTLLRLRQGHDGGVAGSLRAAELAMLDGAGKDFPAAVAHPFYWAPFALIGEGGAGVSGAAGL